MCSRFDAAWVLILTYAGICYANFKFFKIPVNAYTLLTTALGGVFLLGFLLLAMNYNHPFTKEARFFYFTTPIVPTVGGRVVEVAAKQGQHLKAGDVLFRIEDTTYRNAVAYSGSHDGRAAPLGSSKFKKKACFSCHFDGCN